MIEIRKTSITLDETELIELERIITDLDEKEALRYLKKAIYGRIDRAQQGRLKSHQDGNINPINQFKRES